MGFLCRDRVLLSCDIKFQDKGFPCRDIAFYVATVGHGFTSQQGRAMRTIETLCHARQALGAHNACNRLGQKRTTGRGTREIEEFCCGRDFSIMTDLSNSQKQKKKPPNLGRRSFPNITRSIA